MPYEVSMSGGSPWGFRIAGGPFAGKPTTISRVTPGGKAAQANVLQGDVLIAVNGFSISHLDLCELMEMIKLSGWTLHLTLISQEEINQVTQRKRQSEGNITNAITTERLPSDPTPASLCSDKTSRTPSQMSLKSNESKQRPPTPVTGCENTTNQTDTHEEETKDLKPIQSIAPTESQDPAEPDPTTPVPEVPPSPKPRRSRSTEKHEEKVEESTEHSNLTTCENSKKMPDFLIGQLRPQRPLPTFKPQVYWLHDKLRITPKRPNGIKNPGTNLKMAAAAYPCRKIEIEGPVSATIVHSQYNTPVGIYSPTQIVSTLVNTAAASGAKVPDPQIFGDQYVDVDTNTAVYRMVHKTDKPRSAPAQSRSIQILDALLEHGKEIPQRVL